jgi:hypothetical protein
MLYPFWGFIQRYEANELYSASFKEYIQTAPRLFELSAATEAQLAVLPFQWEQALPESIAERGDLEYNREDADTRARKISDAQRIAEDFAAQATNAKLPLVVFFMDDFDTRSASLPDAFHFQPSLLASRRATREFAIPFWLNRDEVEVSFGGEVPLRQKRARPVVSFCGVSGLVVRGVRSKLKRRMAAAPALARGASRLGVELLAPNPYRARAHALYLLPRSRDVQTSFIVRDWWCNGAFARGLDLPRLRQSYSEYIENMLDSDYVLCTRGRGNYSIRFYETLSCGRIPVFVNTDCVLPYEKWIDWKRYCVWIEEDELPHIADKIMEFHERHSPAEFQDLQRECRRLWLEWLSPQGFFKNFYRHFE